MDSSSNLSTMSLPQVQLDQQLLNAAYDGQTDIVKDLIAAGANVNAINQEGSTPLLLSAHNGHTDVVSTLIIAGANINALTSSRATALMLATLKGHLDTVRVLLRACANVNAENVENNTPLMFAVVNGHTAIVSALITAGAKINSVNIWGSSALSYAASSNQPHTVFRLFTAMPLRAVLAFQPNTLLGDLATKCIQVVNEIRDNIFQSLWAFRNRTTNSLPEGPSALIVSNKDLYPEWYHPRINESVHAMLLRVNEVLKRRAEKTNSTKAQLTENAPLIAPDATFLPFADQMAALTIHTSNNSETATEEPTEKKSFKQKTLGWD